MSVVFVAQSFYGLLYGKLVQRVISLKASNSSDSASEKEDMFSYLPINDFDEGSDIYDGLDGYFMNTVTLDDTVRGRMEIEILQLPPLLQVRLQVGRLIY